MIIITSIYVVAGLNIFRLRCLFLVQPLYLSLVLSHKQRHTTCAMFIYTASEAEKSPPESAHNVRLLFQKSILNSHPSMRRAERSHAHPLAMRTHIERSSALSDPPAVQCGIAHTHTHSQIMWHNQPRIASICMAH